MNKTLNTSERKILLSEEHSFNQQDGDRYRYLTSTNYYLITYAKNHRHLCFVGLY